jgi:hypothetical protein
MSHGAVPFHCDEPCHQEQLQKLNCNLSLIKRVMQRCLALSEPFQAILGIADQIMYPPWRDTVQAGLFRCFFDPWIDRRNDSSYEFFREPCRDLRRHAMRESLVVVELAVWKMQCFLQMPVGGDYFLYEQWKIVDWKKCKKEHRACNAVQIIINAVRPFLSDDISLALQQLDRGNPWRPRV